MEILIERDKRRLLRFSLCFSLGANQMHFIQISIIKKRERERERYENEYK